MLAPDSVSSLRSLSEIGWKRAESAQCDLSLRCHFGGLPALDQIARVFGLATPQAVVAAGRHPAHSVEFDAATGCLKVAASATDPPTAFRDGARP